MGPQALHRPAGILHEQSFLLLGVSFRHYGYVDEVLRVRLNGSSAFPDPFMGRRSLAARTDEDVGRVDHMREAAADAAVDVEQRHRDLGLPRGHRQQEHVLERPADPGGLFGRLPFLEQGGEGGGVDRPGIFTVSVLHPHDDLSVPSQGKDIQVDAPARPFFDPVQPGKGYPGFLVRPTEYVVSPQCLSEIEVRPGGLPRKETGEGEDKQEAQRRCLPHHFPIIRLKPLAILSSPWRSLVRGQAMLILMKPSRP